MGRRTIYKAQEIYKLRVVYWTRHYNYRGYASNCGLDPLKVLNALARAKLPDPEIEVDGSIYEPLDVLRARSDALEILGLRWTIIASSSEISITWKDLMCPYFWTEDGWQAYVRLYQALPDPVEDHYLFYDAERDGGRLVPMSSKSKRGDSPVGSPVGKPVDKSGTSQVQVPSHRYKSPVLGGRSGVGE